MGCAVTRITELATEVMVSEVIQKEKCVASMMPIMVISMMLLSGRFFISCCLFLLMIMKGSMMRVVKRSR